MLSWLAIVLSIFLFHAIFNRLFSRSERILRKIPGLPGLLSVPVLGHAYFLRRRPIEKLMEYHKKFGPIFRLDIGPKRTVIICDHDIAVEAYRNDAFSARPWDDVYAHYAIRGRDPEGNIAGMSTTSGQVWRDQRKFMMLNLVQLGNGKRSVIEGIIQDVSYILIQSLAKEMETKKKIHIYHRFLIFSNHVIWRLLTGKRPQENHNEIQHLVRCVSDVFEGLSPSSLINLLQQQSRVFCRIFSTLGHQTIFDAGKTLIDMIEQEVTKYSANKNGRLIERYLAELEKYQDDKKSVFYGKRGYKHMIGAIYDLFLAGTDTVAAFLEWSIFYLIKYPDIQNNLYNEIYYNIGHDRLPSLDDISRTPYVLAFIDEVMRHCPQMSINVPHCTTTDYVAGGFQIPANAQVFIFHGAIHHDKKFFERPEVFNPERFLMSDGTYKRNDHVNPFGIGKRRCAGEALAKPQMYLFLSSMIQAFKFAPYTSPESMTGYTNGLIFKVPPFDFKIQSRRFMANVS